MAAPVLPDRARVVVIGGGVIGTSVAYHLAHMGWKDVVLLERDRLTSGTTWHAAGLIVTFGSTSETSTELRKYTRDLYRRLEAETGQATGFNPVGFIEVAADADRLEEYRRVAAFNRLCGVRVEEISPAEVKKLFPLARVDDILAGFYVADDGRANPVDVTMALAKGARMAGARLIEGVRVTNVLQQNGRVTGVRTETGDIQAEYVVNCAGMWARQLGERDGVTIPNQAAEHYYLITEPIADLPPSMPVLEDPASYGYFREEVGGLLVGLFEPVCAPWHVDGIPEDFSFGEIPPDWDRMTPYLEKAMSRVPIALEVRDQEILLRPGELYARLASDHRRGAGDQELLRGGRPQLDRHPHRRRHRPCVGALDHPRHARRRRDRLQHRPAAQVPGQSRVPPRAHHRVARHGLQVPLPHHDADDRARREDLRDPRAAGRGPRLFPRRQRLGGRRLVCPAGLRAQGREALLGTAELVPVVGGRASRRARGRDPHGHVVHEQIPGAGPRRRPRAQPHLSERRRRRAGPHHLHAMAQRQGHARSRPHGDQARRRGVPGGRDRHHAPPRRNLDAASHSRRCARRRSPT